MKLKKFRIIKFKKEKPILQIKNVSKSFDGRPILKKVSLEVNSGQCVGLLGPNGSGKSTLYGCIIGQYKVDSGSIFLNQKDITEKPIHERANMGVAYLSQNRAVFNLSTYDNLMGIAEICIKNSEKRRLIVENLMSEFNLQHLRNINANLLSGGEVRRVQIARTLLNNPKVVLLDEPCSALDPIVIQDIQKYIVKLALSYRIGILVTDHMISNLFDVVDTCYVLGEQTIIASGTREQILKSTKARELYFGSYS